MAAGLIQERPHPDFASQARPQAFADGIGLTPLSAPYAPNEEIYAEEDATKCVYKVLSGAVRITRHLSDGRRHISAFYLPGEIFGFEPGAAHRFAAEAIADSRIAMVRRAQIEDAALRDPGVGRAMWDLAAQDLERLQEHMLLLGRRSAAQRVAAFLIELSERLNNRDTVDVPMSRTDIADYLGLTIETVSRTLTQFERDGLIEMPSARHIFIKNRAALERLDS